MHPNRRAWALAAALLILLLGQPALASPRPNVLLIMLDDLNTDIGAYGGQAKTPNIDRLASQAVRFEHGYSVVPACNPSRVALMTGQRPETTGQYLNEGNFRQRPGGAERLTLPQRLRAAGYEAVAAGKIFHHSRGSGEQEPAGSDPASWDRQARVDVGVGDPRDFRDANGHAAWLQGAAEHEGVPINAYIRSDGVWGPTKEGKEGSGDFAVARYCADYLRSKQGGQPFMLACGIWRPHSPHIAPREFFDLYPLDQIRMPPVPPGDLSDVPRIAHRNWSTSFARKLRSQPEEWRRAMQGYLASVSFADAAVGEILDALDKSGHADNTVVVLLGDHGFHFGDKDRWEKFTLWDRGGRTTFLMKLPGVGPRVVTPPVSMLDVVPTVLSALGLPRPEGLEGHDLTPLIQNPARHWPYAAVQTYQQNNNGVRQGRWNYIRYQDGSEELYDLQQDPNEWRNLIHGGRGRYEPVVRALSKHLPSRVANPQAAYKPGG